MEESGYPKWIELQGGMRVLVDDDEAEAVLWVTIHFREQVIRLRGTTAAKSGLDYTGI